MKMEYGMYRVNKLYIKYLAKQEPRVIDPKVTSLYVGPVLTIDEKWGYFVPVTPKPEGSDRLFVAEDGAIMGFVHIKKMIPCISKLIKPVTQSTPESEFCMDEDNRKIIESSARLFYEQHKERREKQ